MRRLRKVFVGRAADGGDHTGRSNRSLHSPKVGGRGVDVERHGGVFEGRS